VRRTFRSTVMLVVLSMVVTACGTRLSEDDRELVIAGLTGGGGGGGIVAPSEGVVTDGGETTDGTTSTDGGDTTGTTGGSTAGTAGTTTGGTAGTAGTTTGGTDGGTGGTTGQAGTDTRAAPPGGNGGATDVGVTETEIVIYNVVDVGGVIQGLFEDARDATQAYWAYFSSTEGTIYGRQIKYQFRDAGMSTQNNRSHYLEACQNAFAAVGSMSAFEQGAAGPIKDCEKGPIPDIRTAAVSPEIQTLPTVISTDAMRPGQVPLSEWTYYKEVVGDEGVKKAGYLWINNATTSFQTQQNRDATTKHLGYTWVEEIPIGLSETNYASIIQQLRSSDVQLVAFQGDASQAIRLGEAMREQNWYPQLFGLQSNTYGQKLLDGMRDKAEELVSIYSVAQTGALVEEIQSNQEMQLYAEWLQRVKPGAKPTGLGLYAWASMKLFVDAVKAVGPNLTRAALVEELRKVNDFTANGLLPPQKIGEQIATDCIIMLRIEGGQFVRAEPGNDYRCRPEPGFL